MNYLHLPMRACGKVLLLVAWVWLMLPSTASSRGMLPLELWCQASPRGLLGRPQLIKTALLRMVSQDCFTNARALMAWMRNLYGWELAGKPSTAGSCPVVTMPIDPHGSPCWLPNATISAWSGNRGDRTRLWPIGSMSSSVTSPDSSFTW